VIFSEKFGPLSGIRIMTKTNCAMYGDQELSLHVLNNEFFYSATRRMIMRSQVQEFCDQFFSYTEEQLDELCDDLEIEL